MNKAVKYGLATIAGAIVGCCGYNIIKKIIEMKEDIDLIDDIEAVENSNKLVHDIMEEASRAFAEISRYNKEPIAIKAIDLATPGACENMYIALIGSFEQITYGTIKKDDDVILNILNAKMKFNTGEITDLINFVDISGYNMENFANEKNVLITGMFKKVSCDAKELYNDERIFVVYSIATIDDGKEKSNGIMTNKLTDAVVSGHGEDSIKNKKTDEKYTKTIYANNSLDKCYTTNNIELLSDTIKKVDELYSRNPAEINLQEIDDMNNKITKLSNNMEVITNYLLSSLHASVTFGLPTIPQLHLSGTPAGMISYGKLSDKTWATTFFLLENDKQGAKKIKYKVIFDNEARFNKIVNEILSFKKYINLHVTINGMDKDAIVCSEVLSKESDENKEA